MTCKMVVVTGSNDVCLPCDVHGYLVTLERVVVVTGYFGILGDEFRCTGCSGINSNMTVNELKLESVSVNLHNYCSDDMDINMKSYLLYMVYSTHL